jgi:hypothetical protein
VTTLGVSYSKNVEKTVELLQPQKLDERLGKI